MAKNRCNAILDYELPDNANDRDIWVYHWQGLEGKAKKERRHKRQVARALKMYEDLISQIPIAKKR